MYAEGRLIGLARSFLEAGVHEVVVYQGEVPDSEITCHFVRVFYEEYAKSFEADTSLRSAQIQMIDMGVSNSFWSRYAVYRQ